VVRHHLGALALLAAFAMPLAASAQTFPNPGAPGSAPSAQQQQQPQQQQPPQQQQQQPQRPHHHRRNPYMHAMRGLGLSPAQRQQIVSIMKSSRGADKNADPQTRRANRLAMRQQIDGVLTPDQRTRFHAKLAQARSHMKPNGPAAQAPAQ
jgi:Spy/CpxP family protein refolding chaperone